MLKINLLTLLVLPLIWFSQLKWMWMSSTTAAFLIAGLSFLIIKEPNISHWTFSSLLTTSDYLSNPLLILTCWLLPLTLLASWNQLKNEPSNRQRAFITLMFLLQFFLTWAFSAIDMILFYIMFEATLIPTLMVITRWGNQIDRLNAGLYFFFYTLLGSLPLLIAIMSLKMTTGTVSILMINQMEINFYPSWTQTFLFMACMLAFLVKTPLYGVHLWLPKAHVEAPIAGSMILAAILLKLGSYGMMRFMTLFSPLINKMIYPIMILSLWGVIMTSIICLRQTDLKSLIAYSSVSHMGLITASILIQTPWSLSGAMVLMIAHGLTSSMFFCLANLSYERTQNRSLLLAQGLYSIFPLITFWWLFTNLANIGFPPFPNLMGEMMIISSLFYWSNWTLVFTALGLLATVSYSLYMLVLTQRGKVILQINISSPPFIREHLLLTLHVIPTIMIIFNPEIIWGWLL